MIFKKISQEDLMDVQKELEDVVWKGYLDDDLYEQRCIELRELQDKYNALLEYYEWSAI